MDPPCSASKNPTSEVGSAQIAASTKRNWKSSYFEPNLSVTPLGIASVLKLTPSKYTGTLV
jgi:hypothetical protein